MSESIALSAGRKNKKKLWIVFSLTTGYMLAEAVGGLLTHSLALLADAGHMLTDAGALGLALFAIRFAERPATTRKDVRLFANRDFGRLWKCAGIAPDQLLYSVRSVEAISESS